MMKTKDTQDQVKFNASKNDCRLIGAIARRAVAMNPEYVFMDCTMDIEATHCNGCPLDLQKLLDADDFNLAHDVFGIARHIDRNTGALTDCFVPRCSAPRNKTERKFARA